MSVGGRASVPGERAQMRALVVDDERPLVAIVSSYLEREGFEVLAAYDGEQAVELARSERPDVIVLDLMMPNVSGADVLEALALRDPLHKCVVLMSAASPHEVARSVTPNVCVALRKPFDVAALVAAVEQCVEASCGPAAPREPEISRAA